jgi:acetylornithine deacetylase/succinyl-diaminopimelate desuccinylase-like protein
MRRCFIICATICLLWHPALPSGDRAAGVRAYCRVHEHQILHDLIRLLAIPNQATDLTNIRRNAEAIASMMGQRGLEPRLLEATDPNAPPAVYGELKTPGATRTLMLYAHYDGQPADSREWETPPWQPTLRSSVLESGGQVLPVPEPGEPINPEWRLYARSAADDKAGVVAILAALDALAAAGARPACNLKLFFEGEEEAGSPHLADIISRNRDLLAADCWILFDGPVHQSGRKQVVFGVRGIVMLDITVYGAKRPLHSGHYGNWAPNPAMSLSRLLATLKDGNGRVTVPGFYSDVEPLGEMERRAMADAPQYDSELRSQLSFVTPENPGLSLAEALTRPSLNVDGLSSAAVGAAARNVIPATASATIDMRLVKGNDYRRQTDRLLTHIRRQGFWVIDHEPTEADRREHPLIARVVSRDIGYNALRTRMDLPISRTIIQAVQSVSAQPIVKLPTLGGSLPLSIFSERLHAPMIIVPIANYDNNQHAENENLRLQNLWDGIEIAAAIMTIEEP